MMMVIMMVAMTTFKPIQIFLECTTSQDECVWLSVFSIRNRLFLFLRKEFQYIKVHGDIYQWTPLCKGDNPGHFREHQWRGHTETDQGVYIYVCACAPVLPLYSTGLPHCEKNILWKEQTWREK